MTLDVKNVAKYFGGVKAVDGASFTVEKGKIVALIGPNGSGKSTMFHVISSLYTADAGRVTLNGIDITTKKDYKIAQLGVSRTFQEVRLFRNLTIKEHMHIALGKHDESLFRSFFGILESREEIDTKMKEALSFVGLDKPLDTHVTDLSYGQRKLLDLALAIAKPHQLLMLDEPVAGVNPRLRGTIKKMLKKLRSKGETLLIIEHDMNFIMDIADYVFVMDYGKVIAAGKPKDIQKNKHVLEAYLGE